MENLHIIGSNILNARQKQRKKKGETDREFCHQIMSLQIMFLKSCNML